METFSFDLLFASNSNAVASLVITDLGSDEIDKGCSCLVSNYPNKTTTEKRSRLLSEHISVE